MAAQYRWAGRRDNPMRLLRLIFDRMRQRGFAVEHLREIAHIEKAAARFVAFEKMVGFAQRRAVFLMHIG
jgi:hypothetical protein